MIRINGSGGIHIICCLYQSLVLKNIFRNIYTGDSREIKFLDSRNGSSQNEIHILKY